MIPTAILIVALVIVALSALIVVDIRTGGENPQLGLLRQWQTLIGTMLGFVTGAGILAISTAISAETEQARKADELRRVGEALLVEASTLNEVLKRAEGLQARIDSANGSCPSQVLDINASMARDTPMFDAAVPHFVAVGAPNLSLFVGFYATYGELRRNLASYVSHGCPPVSPGTAVSVFEKLASARKAFDVIEAHYRKG